MTHAFAALLDVIAKGRWGGTAIAAGTPPPRTGCEYAQQRGRVLRRGKVLECLRPVSVTLQETLLDPPCCVKLRLHWRLEPLDAGSCVLLDVRYSLNGAASLRRRHWHERLHGHCARMLGAVRRHLIELERAPTEVRVIHAPGAASGPQARRPRPSAAEFETLLSPLRRET